MAVKTGAEVIVTAPSAKRWAGKMWQGSTSTELARSAAVRAVIVLHDDDNDQEGGQ